MVFLMLVQATAQKCRNMADTYALHLIHSKWIFQKLPYAQKGPKNI